MVTVFEWLFEPATRTAFLYGAAWLVAVALIAYIYWRYRDLAKQFIEEKLAIIKPTIALIEKLLPSLPDEYKQVVTEYLAYLKWLETVNEALSGSEPATWYKKWRQAVKSLGK